jgi:hypothetical protein
VTGDRAAQIPTTFRPAPNASRGTARGPLEDDEQRDQDERRDHQQLEIVDVGK